MIVDSSAMIAILHEEKDGDAFLTKIDAAERVLMSAATFLELAIVVDSRRNRSVSRGLDRLLTEASIIIEPVTEAQARIAREAYRDYGKGSGHPANLNFGDCFAYALARDKGEPLLFKGADFGLTDIRSALA